MNEGSVMVDEGGFPSASSNEGGEESLEVRDDSVKEGGEAQVTETKPEGEDKKPVLTEKGTKLDPNPQSAVHQQLANARRTIQQYQQVLTNPDYLRRYAKEAGMTLTEAKAEIKEAQKEEAKAFTPDKFNTAEDIANALNQLDGKYNKTVEELRAENARLQAGLTGFTQGERYKQVANTMQNDVTSVREKYPELNPKDPSYDKELEGSIGDLYHKLDFDPKTGGYKGEHSLAEITETVMGAVVRGRKSGSEQAQTDVRVKKAGKVVTSSKSTSKEVTESKDPGTVIAQRISKAIKG